MQKIAILFPGQGAQYVGMGKTIAAEFKAAARIFEEANDTLACKLDDIIFSGDMNQLTASEVAQPAILATSYALFCVYMQEIGIEPVYLAGHSLGEITALVATGAIAFKDALLFARQRGLLMQKGFEQKKGHMAVVMGITQEKLTQILEEINSKECFAAISCYNSPEQFLVAGQKEAFQALKKKVPQINGEFIPYRMIAMKVDAPFHSRLMKFIEKDVREEIAKYEFGPFKYDVISNITAQPYVSHEEVADHLIRQLTYPVKWRQTIEYLDSQEVSLALDIGPQFVLRSLVKETPTRMSAYSYDIKEDVVQLKSLFHLDAPNLMKKIELCLNAAASVPNKKCWESSDYRKNVIAPYRKIERTLMELEENGQTPARLHMEESKSLLTQILKAKGLSAIEQTELLTVIDTQ